MLGFSIEGSELAAILGFGIIFEVPILALILGKFGLITDAQLKSWFRYAIIVIFLISALLTPPDVLTQFLMAGPLIILYGLSIIIVRQVNPAKPEASEDEEQASAEQGSPSA